MCVAQCDEPPDRNHTCKVDLGCGRRLAKLEAQLDQLADRHRASCVRLAALEDEMAVRP